MYSAPDRQDIQGSRGALTVALIIKKTKALRIKMGNLETLHKTTKINTLNIFLCKVFLLLISCAE